MSPEMKKMIPRWIVFGIIALAVTIPLVVGGSTKFPATPIVEGVYDEIEKLPEGAPILISSDFDPGSEAELLPMMNAILAHCWRKKLRVVVMSLCSANSMPLAEEIVKEAAAEHGAEYGRDYALMKFLPGGTAPILTLGQSWSAVLPKDYYETPIADLPAMKGITKLTDFPYMVCVASVATPELWILAGNAKYGLKMGAGCTAVSATDYYPYVSTRQLTGLIGGLAGAAQYEALVKRPGEASSKMPTQSVVHVTLVLLIVAGNIIHFLRKRKGSAA